MDYQFKFGGLKIVGGESFDEPNAPGSGLQFDRASDNEKPPKIVELLAKDFEDQEFFWQEFFPTLGIDGSVFYLPEFSPEAWFDMRTVMHRVDGTNPNVIKRQTAKELVRIPFQWLAMGTGELESQHADPILGKIFKASDQLPVLKRIFNLAYELTAAELVQDDSIYVADNKKTLTGASGYKYWDDATDGTPLEDIVNALDVLPLQGNTLAAPARVITALCRHKQFTGTAGKALSNDELASRLKGYGIKRIIQPRAKYISAEDGTKANAWGSNWCFVGRIERTQPNRHVRSFGYSPFVKGYPKPWTAKTELSRETMQVYAHALKPMVLDNEAAFFFKTPMSS